MMIVVFLIISIMLGAAKIQKNIDSETQISIKTNRKTLAAIILLFFFADLCLLFVPLQKHFQIKT